VQNLLHCHCPESLGLNKMMSLKNGKKLHNENFHSFSSSNTVKGIISRKQIWEGFVECIQETRNAYITVAGKPEETTCR
jgi:hypothetical protein